MPAQDGADDGIRTRDLRFTKPLLYQLSYVGTSGANIASTGAGYKSATRLAETRLQRQYESFANFAERDAFRSLAKDSFETLYGFPQRFETEPEGLMMHRHDEFRSGGIGHLDRLLWRAMVPDPWVVSCDRHDREIDGPVLVKLGKSVRQRGVPSEQDAPSISLD